MFFIFVLNLFIANKWKQIDEGKEEEQWNLVIKRKQSMPVNTEVLDMGRRSYTALVQVSMGSAPCRFFAI